MPFFNRAQLDAYLKYRFSNCGENVEAVFSEQELDYIYQVSAGLPGGINTIGRSLMQQRLSDETSKSGHSVLLPFLLFIIVCVAAYYYYDSYYSIEDKSVSVEFIPVILGQETESEMTEGIDSTIPIRFESDPSDSLTLKLSEALADRDN